MSSIVPNTRAKVALSILNTVKLSCAVTVACLGFVVNNAISPK